MLLMVFTFMALLMLMTKARNPDTWAWMWALDGSQASNAEAKAEQSAADLDSRPKAEREPSSSEVPIIGMDTESIAPVSLDVDQLPESLQTAQLDGWDSVLQSLDRSQQLLLRIVLWNSRRNVPLSEPQQSPWEDLLAKLDERWKNYHNRALLLVASDRDQMTDEQKRVCLEVLELSKRSWEKQREALVAAVDPDELTVGHREQLTQLQRTLDERALNLIEDNRVLRSVENEAWFRLWENLNQSESLPEATHVATYVQLFSQPNEYRGRLVKVKGQARMAYHVQAAKNPFGIEGYYVFAVLPQEGGDNPLIVYCLDVPDGFPAIKDRDVDRGTTTLRDDMEFTGYFFKRWVYQSRGGPNLAPLVIARVSQWKPRTIASTSAKPPPKFGTVALVILGLAVIAAGFAWWVYRKSQWSTTKLAPSLAAGAKVAFDVSQVRPGVKQSLQALDDRPPTVDESREAK
jgi:hypothetical protein